MRRPCRPVQLTTRLSMKVLYYRKRGYVKSETPAYSPTPLQGSRAPTGGASGKGGLDNGCNFGESYP